MIRGYKIQKFKNKCKEKRIGFYNKPKFVYIPLISGDDTDLTVAVKKGDYVYKGSIIGKRKGNFRLPIHSSVSGTVVDYEQKTCYNGSKVKCVVIENDFKEKEEIKKVIAKEINQYTKEEFLKIIQDCGIIGMGGNGYPTYLKYNTDVKINTLIINATESESYVVADYSLLKQKSEEILECIDAIMEINEIDKAYIAIKRKDQELKKVLDLCIGTYLKIKIIQVPDLYPIGWERSLVKYVCKKDYDKYPIEKGIITNNVSTIYAMYEALKYNKPLTERIVTFAGNGINNSQNVYVKVGTLINEVINKIGGAKEECNYIAGGPMMGKLLENDELVITNNLNCVLILQKENSEKILPCNRCGKCVQVCPSKLSPVLIKDNIKDKNKLKDLQTQRCCNCGLCSYICPAKINLRNLVNEAKEMIGDDK